MTFLLFSFLQRHFLDIDPNRKIVVAYVTLSFSDRSKMINMTSLKVHPDFDPNSISMEGDIAIIELASSFTPGSNAQVVEIANASATAGSKVDITGWGGIPGTTVENLQIVKDLVVVDRKECAKIWAQGGITVTKSMMCTNVVNGMPCIFDNGGPVVQSGKLVGMVGNIILCHTPEDVENTIPRIYIDVAHYRDWIKANGARSAHFAVILLVPPHFCCCGSHCFVNLFCLCDDFPSSL